MVFVCFYKDGAELPYFTVKWFLTLAEAYVEIKLLAYATLLMRQVNDQYIDDYAGSYAVCDVVRDYICERFSSERILGLLPETIGQRLETWSEFHEPTGEYEKNLHGAYIATDNEFTFYLNRVGYRLEECTVILPHTLENTRN